MFRATPQGVQVMDDVLRRKPPQWIALDDDLEGWPDTTRHHVVECHGAAGLSNPEVQRELKERLQRCHALQSSSQPQTHGAFPGRNSIPVATPAPHTDRL